MKPLPPRVSKHTALNILGVIIALLLSSCSQTPYSEQTVEQSLADEQLERGESVEEISYMNFDTWKYLDKFHMLVKTNRNNQYLISFTHRCSSFSKSAVPIFEYRTRTLTKFDSIKIMDTFGGAHEVCPIDSIIKLNTIDYDAPIDEE